jgi:cardiolipin synthase
MTNQYTLFTRVQDYYTDLLRGLASAQHDISMVCLSFDHGIWAEQISSSLAARSQAGVRVRLMVDGLGELTDEPRHILRNRALLKALRAAGVQVEIFHPAGMAANHRMHCKFAAIDEGTVYLGGSNVGDYYTAWSDTNLRVDGSLGPVFHELFDGLKDQSIHGDRGSCLDPAHLPAGNDCIELTLPTRCTGIRSALLQLIRSATRSVYIRTWYFLPDPEILGALEEQARRGVQVNVLLSHRTRIPPVDLANHIHIHRLVLAGAHVYRYLPRYMHAKAAWNDRGDVLLGSANLDPHSMHTNFESCLRIQSIPLAQELRRAFEADLPDCIPQTANSQKLRPWHEKVLVPACHLAAGWL